MRDDEYRLVAPDIGRLLHYFEHQQFMNPSKPSAALAAAIDPLFSALSGLAPHPENDEVKQLWLMVPRGSIDDYDSYEDMLEWDEVRDRTEYEERWREDYPDELCWYQLTVSEGYHKDGTLRFRGVSLGRNQIVSADFGDRAEENSRGEVGALLLLPLLTEAARQSMALLTAGLYNNLVSASLPYPFRTGVIRRSIVWDQQPEWKERAMEGLRPEELAAYKKLLTNGANDERKLVKLKTMTANDFFRACSIGYHACGYDGLTDLNGAELPLIDQYFAHADGRDEGLSGRGHGLNAGPGIDFDDPAEWDKWYHHREQHGGHPWEVCRGGNSTHVDLFVRDSRDSADWKLRLGKISESEAEEEKQNGGYFFTVAGKHRGAEAIRFYLALHAAGLPVTVDDAAELLARFEASDYIGIVPHDVIPRYCEGMFPEKYGRVIDFTHVYQDEDEWFDQIIWLPEPEARLVKD